MDLRVLISDDDLDSIGLNVTDNPDHLWGKTKLSFEYIYKNHLYDYDWFLKADDDTYMIVENVRYMLYQYSTGKYHESLNYALCTIRPCVVLSQFFIYFNYI